jgi:hypothetical protein
MPMQAGARTWGGGAWRLAGRLLRPSGSCSDQSGGFLGRASVGIYSHGPDILSFEDAVR